MYHDYRRCQLLRVLLGANDRTHYFSYRYFYSRSSKRKVCDIRINGRKAKGAKLNYCCDYDLLNRPTQIIASQTQVIAGVSYTTRWQYNDIDLPTRITYPNGIAVSYQYEGYRVRSVQAHIGSATLIVASELDYKAFGPLAALKYGSLVWRYQDWDRLYQPVNIRSAGLQSLSYTINNGQEITRISNGIISSQTQSYGYDAASRLRSVTAGTGNESWSFDANSNRSSHVWGGITDSYRISTSNNRLNSIAGDRSRSYQYDLRGNLTSRSGYGGSHSYAYDPFNRMQRHSDSITLHTQYQYNALNQRVRKSNAFNSYNYLLAPDGSLLGETANGSNTVSTVYIWLQGAPIAMIRNNTLYYIHNDHLGRAEVISNQAKQVVWRANLQAYDRKVTTNQIGGYNLGFPGQYYDGATGLWYNWNRYYDASTGRYTQSDPIGLDGGLNTYLYALASPAMFVDYDGARPVRGPQFQPARPTDQFNANTPFRTLSQRQIDAARIQMLLRQPTDRQLQIEAIRTFIENFDPALYQSLKDISSCEKETAPIDPFSVQFVPVGPSIGPR
jgi:RHS repeat-associated protein